MTRLSVSYKTGIWEQDYNAHRLRQARRELADGLYEALLGMGGWASVKVREGNDADYDGEFWTFLLTADIEAVQKVPLYVREAGLPNYNTARAKEPLPEAIETELGNI